MSTYCYSIGLDGRQTSSVIVGNSPNLHGWVRSDVYFHRFADSNPERNQHVTSPSFSCFGRDWTIKVEDPVIALMGTLSLSFNKNEKKLLLKFQFPAAAFGTKNPDTSCRRGFVDRGPHANDKRVIHSSILGMPSSP
jgi:hypothetical protein